MTGQDALLDNQKRRVAESSKKLESRRGSGLYVCAIRPSNDAAGDMDRLLAALLQAGGLLGYQPEDILRRLERKIRPHAYQRILTAEPDAAMFEILSSEIGEHFTVPVARVDAACSQYESAVVAARKIGPGTVDSAQSEPSR